jgi:ferric-dicitrate binding protein FerR (iron transport regulator)
VLSDHDRKTLDEVERHCMAEDPAFARSFQERQTRLSRRPHQTGAAVAIAVAALLTTLMLIVGSLAGALAFATVTGLIWMAWRHSIETSRQSP